jgi:Tol biopolymer transport system component
MKPCAYFTLACILICVLTGCTQTKELITPEPTVMPKFNIASPTMEPVIPPQEDDETYFLDEESDIGKCDLPWLPSIGNLRSDWSVDGHLLAFSTGEELYAIDTTNLLASTIENKAFRLSQETFDLIYDIAWSSDGQKLAFIGVSQKGGLMELFILDRITGETKSITGFVTGANLNWSPDGQQIIYTASNYELPPNLRIIEVLSGQHSAVTTLPRGNSYVSDPFWSFDGLFVAFGIYPSPGTNGDSTIQIFSLMNGKVSSLSPEGSCDYLPNFSPINNSLIFLSKRDNQWDIYMMDAEGENEQRLTNTLMFEAPASWSPDGTKIAYVSHDMPVYMHEPAWIWNDLLILDVVTGQSLELVHSCFIFIQQLRNLPLKKCGT